MLSTSVCRLCVLDRKPTFMSVQLVCCGCGSEFMSWPTPSLLTKVTRVPRATTSSRGETPAAVMVIVAPPAGGGVGAGAGAGDGVGEGALGESPPPHETTASDEPMVRVRAARLAAQSDRGMRTSDGATVEKTHSLPRG